MSLTDSDLDEMESIVGILSKEKSPDVKVMATTIVEAARELDGPQISNAAHIMGAIVNELGMDSDSVYLAVSILTGSNHDPETSRMLAYGLVIGHKLAMKQVHS